jgi:hypothetical protein
MLILTIRLDPAEERRVRAAAEAAGVPVERWIHTALVEATSKDPSLLDAAVDAIAFSRLQLQVSDLVREARVWLSYGFSSAEIDAWLASGCSVPAHGAALRAHGIDPASLGSLWRESYERTGTALTLGAGLDRGHLTVDEVVKIISTNRDG